MNRVCVYAGSNVGARVAYVDAAVALARAIVARGWGVVYGGGNVGLMGVLADAALDAGGEVIGVIPEALLARELGHGDVTELRVVKTMHERKALMAELSDAFVALPGGFGTVEELVEAATWTQLGLHSKPVGLLDVDGFWDALMSFFDTGVVEGFVRAQQREIVFADPDIESLLDRLGAWVPPTTHKWIDLDTV